MVSGRGGLRRCTPGCGGRGRRREIVRIPAHRIPEDVIAGMVEVAERKDREARDYRERSAAVVGDGPREQELRRWYDSGARSPPTRRSPTAPVAPASTRRWSAESRSPSTGSPIGPGSGRSTRHPRYAGWTGPSSHHPCPNRWTWCDHPPTPSTGAGRAVRVADQPGVVRRPDRDAGRAGRAAGHDADLRRGGAPTPTRAPPRVDLRPTGAEPGCVARRETRFLTLVRAGSDQGTLMMGDSVPRGRPHRVGPTCHPGSMSEGEP